MIKAAAKPAFTGFLMEFCLASLLSAGIFLLWPLMDLPRLAHEEIWSSLAWFLLLVIPGGLKLFVEPNASPDASETLQADACGYASYALAGAFLLLLAAGNALGNYKLWLGLTYLAGVTMRITGLTLSLRAYMLKNPKALFSSALAGAGIAGLAALFIIPWARNDLVTAYPLTLDMLLPPLACCLLWGGIAGASLLSLRMLGGSERLSWLAFLALALGPGPVFAATWFQPLPLLIIWFILAAIVAAGKMRNQQTKPHPELQVKQPLTLYWLLRAILLLWWGVGLALAVVSAWWHPQLPELLLSSSWPRAVGLGAFLVLSFGILAEYSLPLLGVSPLISAGAERKVLGVVFSALALLAALPTLLFIPAPPDAKTPKEYVERARADILPESVLLDKDNPEVSLNIPGWLRELSHIFIISRLEQGGQVKNGSAVAQLVAIDSLEIPHIYNLRAGVDTADGDLKRQGLVLSARHEAAHIASSRMVYTATGESYNRLDYYSGLFLGRMVPGLKSIRIKLLHQEFEDAPVRLRLNRVFLY